MRTTYILKSNEIYSIFDCFKPEIKHFSEMKTDMYAICNALNDKKNKII